jgi:hypothetical protein
MAEVRGERDRGVVHAALDFGGEFFALFDAGAAQVYFCLQGVESFSGDGGGWFG